MSPVGRKAWLRRLTKRGDVGRLVRLLAERDWLVDRDGVRRDLAVGRRLDVIAALEAIGTAEAEEGLLAAMTDEQPRVRLAAVDALAGAPAAATAENLARAVAGWRDPAFEDARRRALEILSGHGNSALGAAYAAALIDGPHADLTTEEIAAMRQLFAVPGGDEVASAFAARIAPRLGGEAPCVRQTLTALGEPAVDALVEALADPSRRRAAADALGEIRSARAVDPLVALLSDHDAATRAVAARALGRIRDPRALQGLIRAGMDPDAGVRDAALDAIDRLGAIVAALDGASSVERVKAANTTDVRSQLAGAGRSSQATPRDPPTPLRNPPPVEPAGASPEPAEPSPAVEPADARTERDAAPPTPLAPTRPRRPTLRQRLMNR
ncbi:MAG: hypothetical protein QOH72_2226 [Solirubrobacteraceae bacterium]|nr:hypothetical protein [Solirubrobacteraceae bacterium]